ncbi:MAG: radical SAM protein [bacterium]
MQYVWRSSRSSSARGIRKKYLVYARADFIATHEEIIKEWAELGLSAVFIGLEAATDSELDAMNKECTVDYNRRAIEVLRRHGVDTHGSLIPQPDYLPADWERLWSFIETTGLYYVNISPLTPMPGTDIWKDYEDKISDSREAHGLWDLSHCVLPTRMPLKEYYRSLLRLYARTVLDIRRANRLTLRTRPPV